MPKAQLSPSLLSADCARLGEMAQLAVDSGADRLHFDVMDNHYVPNLTFGPMVLQSLKDYGISVPMDVHLMTEPVDSLVAPFAKAGAASITFHPEATRHVDRTIGLIKSFDIEAGVALNPATPIEVLDYTIHNLDLILIMTVNPGFGGQSFIEGMLDKIAAIRAYVERSGRNIRIEVDGGVNKDNIAQIVAKGANSIVAGNAVFGAKDIPGAIKELKAKF